MGPVDESNTDKERDDAKIRRRRNLVMAALLGGLVLLFFLMTIVRIGDFYGP